jgi:hypothetical protein
MPVELVTVRVDAAGVWLPKITSGLAHMQRWVTLIAGMIDLLKLLVGLLVGVFRSHAAREAEMAFLRQQLVVLQRRRQQGSGCARQIA